MKKIFSVIFYIFLLTKIFSNTPETLKGIWKSDDRLIFLGNNNQLSILLNLYYGWYYDRTVEPDFLHKEEIIKPNLATQKKPLEYKIEYVPLENKNTWEIKLLENNKIISTIPIALINEKIYLNFLVKENINEEVNKFTTSSLEGFWKGINFSQNIKISERINQKNIISWFITNNSIYRLRYWQTDMEKSNSNAFFADGTEIYSIPKHILSSNILYTCTNGKRSNIRNVEKYNTLPFEYVINNSNNVIGIGKPSFTKISDTKEIKDILLLEKEQNSKKKPPYPPLFADSNLDWHWDLINNLEKNNKIIQEVRKRQNAFGPRAKEVEEK